MDWLSTLEARSRAQANYDKTNTKGVYMKLNLKTDQDIIQWLWHQKSMQGSIKKLIRENINQQNAADSQGGKSVL